MSLMFLSGSIPYGIDVNELRDATLDMRTQSFRVS